MTMLVGDGGRPGNRNAVGDGARLDSSVHIVGTFLARANVEDDQVGLIQLLEQLTSNEVPIALRIDCRVCNNRWLVLPSFQFGPDPAPGAESAIEHGGARVSQEFECPDQARGPA